jgi:long-chain acyl-CoA synthetase
VADVATTHLAWDWLASRFGQRGITPATTLDELDVDSLDWLQLTTEIEQAFGVRLTGDTISRIENVGDLLRAVTESVSTQANPIPSPLQEPEEFLGEECRFWFNPLGSSELVIARCIHALNWLTIRVVNRVSVCGLEQLPPRGPFILAPHHVSYLDAFVLSAALDFRLIRKCYWAAWTGIAYGPVLRSLRRLTHVVPVDSSHGAASSLAYGAAVLRSQHNLIWFPEGKLSCSGDVLELKPGIGILLAHYPVPVIPVHIEGTHKALPPGKLVPRPGRMQVTFETPLDPDNLAGHGSGATRQERITSALHDAMSRYCRPK